MARLAAELKQPSQEWLVRVYAAQLALLQGGIETADAAILAARTVGEAAHSWNAEVTYRLQLYVLRYRQGAAGDVEDLVRRSRRGVPDVRDLALRARARMAASSGMPREARAALDALAADGFAAIPDDEEWLVGMCLLAEAAAALGATGPAATLYDAARSLRRPGRGQLSRD